MAFKPKRVINPATMEAFEIDNETDYLAARGEGFVEMGSPEHVLATTKQLGEPPKLPGVQPLTRTQRIGAEAAQFPIDIVRGIEQMGREQRAVQRGEMDIRPPKEVIQSLNPLNAIDEALRPGANFDPIRGGVRTAGNLALILAGARAMPKPVLPAAGVIAESGAARSLANAMRLGTGENIKPLQLGEMLESTRSYTTGANRGGMGASRAIAEPSNAAEMVNSMRMAAAKMAPNAPRAHTLLRAADLLQQRILEARGAPQGGMANFPSTIGSVKYTLWRRIAEQLRPGEETVMNRAIREAVRGARGAPMGKFRRTRGIGRSRLYRASVPVNSLSSTMPED